MHLVEILLPLRDNGGRPLPPDAHARTRAELADRFGGLTAFTRAPAEGLWRDEDETARDEIVVLEVMDPDLDRAWWSAYRAELEARFRQKEIVIRATAIARL